MMRLGWFRAVHVKNVEMQKMPTLLTNRKLLKRKPADIENHIRGALRTYGLLVGAVSRGQYEARERELIERTDIVFSTMIETMLDARWAIFDGYAKLHRVLLQMVQHDQIYRRLMAVPGVGPVAALSFKVGVDDPLRFTRSRTVGAHFGLTPRRHQSGTSIDYEGRIPQHMKRAAAAGADHFVDIEPHIVARQMVGQRLAMGGPFGLLVLDPWTALLGTGDIAVEVFKPEGELVGIETLGTAAELRALQLLDDGFQAVDFAVAMFDRGGDIAHQAMQKRRVCRKILEIDPHVRFYSNQLIRRRDLAIFDRSVCDSAGKKRPPEALRRTPVDAFEQHR